MQTAETPYPKSTFVYGDTGQVYSQASDPYTLLLERVRALEVIVAMLRDELAELKDEPTDAAIEDMAAYIDELDPDGWIGGTECDDEE